MLLIVPFRRCQRGGERERPDAPGPGGRHEQHEPNPAQPARLHEVLMAGAHGISIDPFGRDAFAPAPFDRLIAAEQQRPGRGESGHQETQQDAADREAGPLDPIQDPMIALKTPSLRQAHHPRGGRDGPIAGSEQGAGDEPEGGRPDATAEEWREHRQQG
jgi:hypothetical protein